MTARKILRRIHLVATVWFIICVGYLLVIGLYQAGLKWWLVFSLSGHSAVVIVLLVSLYLFAFFRGTDGARHIEAEHPLTSSDCYMGFYVSAPLLGGLAAVLGTVGASGIGRLLFSTALGTLGTTFLVWIVIDPLVGMVEMLLPTSRRHRAERIGGGRPDHILRGPS